LNKILIFLNNEIPPFYLNGGMSYAQMSEMQRISEHSQKSSIFDEPPAKEW